MGKLVKGYEKAQVHRSRQPISQNLRCLIRVKLNRPVT